MSLDWCGATNLRASNSCLHLRVELVMTTVITKVLGFWVSAIEQFELTEAHHHARDTSFSEH